MSDALKQFIIKKIQDHGPMHVDAYMEHCLSHPEHGYYIGRDPLGRAGDFITSPEISQMFGEMIGAWLVHAWQSAGSPDQFVLMECGPGRGTLMADILRVAAQVPEFMSAAQICLIEISPVLRAKQEAALKGYDVNWYEDISHVPDGCPLFVVANEFFDALPLKQFIYLGGEWRERCIDTSCGDLIWRSREASVHPHHVSLKEPSEGDIVEYAPVHEAVFKGLCQRVQDQGGAGLVIDYGYFEQAYGESLQAVKNNRFTDILAEPGCADVTVHVNFRALAEIAHRAGLQYVLNTQGDFLKRCGIEYRAQALRIVGKAKEVADIDLALRRLCDSDQMGSLFKVIEFSKGLENNACN